MTASATTSRPVFLQAAWRFLLMINFEVPAQILEPLVPRGTTLDLFNGRALISVVGFRFQNTRLLRMPIPLHRDFDEINLRFYVRREEVLPDGSRDIRRGVSFIRELVPRRAIAIVARYAYNEPYVALPMRSTLPTDATPSRPVEYSWRWRKTWEYLRATPIGNPAPLAPNSEEGFITEHYWGYTRQRDGSTVEYQVKHPRWNFWHCDSPRLSTGVPAFYGEPFAPFLSAPPVSAFLADGSDVTVHRPRTLFSK